MKYYLSFRTEIGSYGAPFHHFFQLQISKHPVLIQEDRYFEFLSASSFQLEFLMAPLSLHSLNKVFEEVTFGQISTIVEIADFLSAALPLFFGKSIDSPSHKSIISSV